MARHIKDHDDVLPWPTGDICRNDDGVSGLVGVCAGEFVVFATGTGGKVVGGIVTDSDGLGVFEEPLLVVVC